MIKLGARQFILVQPSSTVLVYLLGIITIVAGIYFLRTRASQQSRWWWGIALLLWGSGALFAGTSYQAFSYEIKCAGKAQCSLTSWWEVIYLILSVASVDALLIASAYACSTGKWRKALTAYGFLNITLYTLIVLVGAFSLTRFLISFELLLMVTAPTILLLFLLNGWKYVRHKNSMDLALLITWTWLGIVIGGYFIYLALDITHTLWRRGIWFSENDVLHIGLISWMLYMVLHLTKHVVDAPASGTS